MWSLWFAFPVVCFLVPTLANLKIFKLEIVTRYHRILYHSMYDELVLVARFWSKYSTSMNIRDIPLDSKRQLPEPRTANVQDVIGVQAIVITTRWSPSWVAEWWINDRQRFRKRCALSSWKQMKHLVITKWNLCIPLSQGCWKQLVDH